MEELQPNKDSSEPTVVKRVHKSETKRYSEIFREFDNLDLSFMSSDGEDLLGDSDFLPISEGADITEQSDVPVQTEASETEGNQTAQEADLALCRCEDGVETALQYTKMWCRYAKDLLVWMEKRISLEQEFAKNVMKTAEGARANMAQQEMLPLQYIYIMALEQDIKNSLTSRRTSEKIQNRCYQALTAKRNEIDKWRREFKEQWAREQRRMNDAVNALKKAKQQYFQRCDDLEKAKAVSAKALDDTAGIKTIDKRRKSKDEAQTKVGEAELLYRQCVSEAKIHQDNLERVKERIISHIRKLICQGDTVLKEVTVNMFYFQRQQTEPVPLGYHNLELTCRSLEPGEPYLLYILSRRRPEQSTQTFVFQDYVPQGKCHKRKTSGALSSLQDSSLVTEDFPCRRSIDGKKVGHSDSESFGGSLESLSSPGYKRLPKTASTLTVSSDDLDDRDVGSESECIDGQSVKARMLSRAALTHRLKKMKSKMVKCKQCENYIVVSGVECEECGLALHRKCMEVCQLECEHRKGTVFGVDLSVLCRDRPGEVPFVVQHCTSEIESRALSVQGVYRVSGSKPRIQKLCQAFETQKEQVDLSDLSPHDITSILKHFFKELPEPLLTFDLYNDFIALGKSIQHMSETSLDPTEIADIIHRLQKLLQKLPSYCFCTLLHMTSHLQKVSENYDNKMSSSNLGIVFGPTLLRPLVSMDMSMVALLETSYQALLVEFLITHHDKIFGVEQRPSTPPPPVPTAPLPETPSRASCPIDGVVDAQLERDTSSKERPRSLESRSIKRDSSEGYISDKSSSNEAVDQLSPDTNERAVLAMRAATAGDPQGDSVVEPASDLGYQTHYRFTRQPVKYYRHHNPGTCLSNPGCATRQWTAPTGLHRGSADSSRSSSPEQGTRRLSQNLDAHFDNTQPLQQVTTITESNVDVPLSPREVAQYMLGLDSTFAPPAAASSSGTAVQSTHEVAAGWQTQRNENPNNSPQSAGQSHALHPSKAVPAEYNLTSSAQKILSGLKLRRSHSGKDEQLFV